MMLTWLPVVLFLFLMLALWALLLSKFRLTTALIAWLIIFIFVTPYAFDLYAGLSHLWFARNKSGEVQISETPMKIPARADDSVYCRQFVDQDNKPLQIISIRDDGAYCGSYWHDDKFLMIPFKRLPNGQAKYWAAPGLKIVGKLPKIVAEADEYNFNNERAK